MFNYQILQHPESFVIDEARVAAIFEYIATQVSITQKWTLNIAFLTDDEIQVYNNLYRWINKTTDVLSFHYFDDFTNIGDEDIAWEIIMSESKVQLQSVEHNHSGTSEFEILLIHGILHILGYDHEDDWDYEEMWKYEKPIREYFGLKS